MTRALALIDGNSFYCSCERVFAPQLATRPVIVLSNNDGCAVARTAEAKSLGIRMGAPFFQIRDLCRREGVAVFSSNYTLYGDMSRRMNAIYHRFSPKVEVYSIDESFLDLSDVAGAARMPLARELRATVRQWTGIPTCVGIGPTKTLAKLANWVAKHHPELGGVCDFTDEDLRTAMMAQIPVAELWGVGRASAAKLARVGVTTVAGLRDMPPPLARQLLTVVGERIVHELNGTACLALETAPPQRKGIAVTRSFGRPIATLEEMREAIALYATRAAEKLRRHGVAAVTGQVFMHTSAFNGDPWCHAGRTLSLLEPTNDTHDLVRAATRAAEEAWRDGFRFVKAGIVLTELVPIEGVQRSLLAAIDRDRRDRLMQALDEVNRRHGRGTLYPAALGVGRRWATKFEQKSPCYTTRLDELPIVGEAP